MESTHNYSGDKFANLLVQNIFRRILLCYVSEIKTIEQTLLILKLLCYVMFKYLKTII